MSFVRRVTILATAGLLAVGGLTLLASPATAAVAPTISGSPNATATVGTPFNYSPTLTGTPAPTVAVVPSAQFPDQLPSGLTLNANTGVISGAPAAGTVGVYGIRLRATNTAGSDNRNLTLTVNQAPTIAGAANATATVGTPFNYSPTLTGVPAPTVAVVPNVQFPDQLPSGLTLNVNTGVISGVPTAGTGGVYGIRLRATNAAGSDHRTLTLTVNEAAGITGAATATGEVGDPFTYTPTTLTGFPAPTVAVNPNGNNPDQLPSGLTLNANTGVISGTPVAGSGGLYKVRLRASNGSNSNLPITITINESPTFEGAATATGKVGDLFAYTPTALSGFPAPTVTLTDGTLPGGLTLNSTTGAISGTPAVDTGGVHDVELTASNGIDPDAVISVQITINEAPVVTGPATASGKAGDPFTYTPDILDGFPPPTVTLTDGTLPAGLTLDANTGVISGTPTPGTFGTSTVTLTASNGVDPSASLTVAITIEKDDVEGLDPTITGLAKVGQTLTADEGPVVPSDATFTYQWNANGNPITNATGKTYKLKKGQAGKTVTVTITASATGYEPQTETSDPTEVVRELVKYPVLTLDRTTASRGGQLGLIGKGLVPGATYQVGIGFKNFTTATADQYGEINSTVTVPNSAKTGIQIATITAPNGKVSSAVFILN